MKVRHGIYYAGGIVGYYGTYDDRDVPDWQNPAQYLCNTEGACVIHKNPFHHVYIPSIKVDENNMLKEVEVKFL